MHAISIPSNQKKTIKEALSHLQQHSKDKLILKLESGKEILLPVELLSALQSLTEMLAEGQTVRLVPIEKILTTQQAADLLNLSRQYLVTLLEKGKIPFHKVGSHRRLQLEDVLRYKEERNRTRSQSLQELVDLSKELSGYPELDLD